MFQNYGIGGKECFYASHNFIVFCIVLKENIIKMREEHKILYPVQESSQISLFCDISASFPDDYVGERHCAGIYKRRGSPWGN